MYNYELTYDERMVVAAALDDRYDAMQKNLDSASELQPCETRDECVTHWTERIEQVLGAAKTMELSHLVGPRKADLKEVA